MQLQLVSKLDVTRLAYHQHIAGCRQCNGKAMRRVWKPCRKKLKAFAAYTKALAEASGKNKGVE